MIVQGIKDLFAQGIRDGWSVTHAGQLGTSQQVACDVVIVGTGAGGGVTAEILATAGLSVVLIEEGPLRTSNQFNMDEKQAYQDLYQEGAARTSADGAITILQGRSVGGSTTINWTSSFRTPAPTLQAWSDGFALHGCSAAEMAPWFKSMEDRLNIHPWEQTPNANNQLLGEGCKQLGYSYGTISRNVRGCWNLGYCGMGCPTNAKQSMLVTTLPEALKRNAHLYFRARAEQLLMSGDRVLGVVCHGMKEDGIHATGTVLTVHARHTVLAGGGINTPGLLLRSQVPNPHQRIGQRTFLHLVNSSRGIYAQEVQAAHGAPQSIYSDHFVWKDGVHGPMGYKLEVMPLHPALTAALVGESGPELAMEMHQFRHMSMMLGLMRDGFHEGSPGGTISLRDDRTPVVNYPLTDYIRDGLRRSLLSMAEIQFAAGAKSVRPLHRDALSYTSLAQAQAAIKDLAMEKFHLRLGSAHVMGGCAMGEDEKQCVTDSLGRLRHVQHCSIHDGSLFPTSIGANPQLSIYAQAARLSTNLVAELTKLKAATT
ncbi:MAG: FAD-binding protein [Pseudomonadales bacterium]|nr:FAD-binding protein [Pseudomonadales bacterium]